MGSWFRLPHVWYVVGFTGQLLFGSRFLVQWFLSEKARRPILPRVFWYLSLSGGLALLAYAVHRHDAVFAIGQAAGLVVYLRNLRLERNTRPA
jgi:lipid-A-disaccharide synthase-like uncharacterized protein